jgi:hypothetical protein
MAPAMAALEAGHRTDLNVVLLNVDNPRWSPEMDRYEVNGIPQLEFFDAAGGPVGRSLGARSGAELEMLTTALIHGDSLPRLAGVGAVSSLGGSEAAETPSTQAGPRSHG